MAEKPSDSFVSDYIAQQRDVYKQQIMGQTPKGISDPTPLKPQVPEMGFLGGVIDFLSRPLYAATNIADKVLELPERVERGEALQGIGDLLVSPVTGFFSGGILGEARPGDKNYTSDIIEKAADVVNRDNPTYVDVEDNVDPITKGSVGFLGDLVFDPLAYVPGAAIAKGLGAVTRGTKAVTGKARTALGIPKADEAAETLAKVTEQPDVRNVGDVVNNNPAPAQSALKASEVIRQSVAKGDLPAKTYASGLRATVNAAKFKSGQKPLLRTKMANFLDNLKLEKIVSLAPAPQREMPFDEWLTEATKFPEGVDLSDVPINTTKVGSITLKQANLQEFVNKINSMPDAQWREFEDKYADVFAEDILRPIYNRQVEAIRAGERVDILGRPVPEAEVLTGAAAAVARLAELAGTERANAEAILGPELFGSIRRMDPARMAKFLDAAQKVAAKNGVVEAMGPVRRGSAEAKLLNRFGIDLDTFRAAQDDLAERINALRATGPAKPLDEAIDGLLADRGFMAELTARLNEVGLSGDIVDDSAEAIRKALKSSFIKNFDTSDLVARGYKPTIAKNGEVYVTDEELGKGVARILNSYNSGAQNDFYEALSKEFDVLYKGILKLGPDGKPIKKLEGKTTVYEYEELPAYVRGGRGSKAYRAYKGYDLAELKEKATIAALKSAEDYVSSRGIPIVMDTTPVGALREVKTLRFSDIYELSNIGLRQLANAGIVSPLVAERLMQLLLFNGDTGLSRAQFMEASLAVMRGAEKDELLAVLRATKDKYGRTLDPKTNWLAGKNKKGEFGFYPKNQQLPNVSDIPGLELVPFFKQIKGENVFMGHKAVWASDDAANYLADAMIAGRSGFDNVAQIRKEQYLARSIEEVNTFAPEIATNLIRLFTDEQATRNALQAVDNLGSIVIDYAKAIDATELAAVYGAGAVRNVIPSTVHSAAKYATAFEEALARGDEAYLQTLRKQAADENSKDFIIINDDGLRAAENVATNPQAFDEETVAQAARVADVASDTPPPQHNGFAQILLGVSKILSPLNAKWGMDVRNHLATWLEFQSLGVSVGTYLSKLKTLDNLRRKYPTSPDGKVPLLTEAMRELQTLVRQSVRGGDDVLEAIAKQSNPALREAMTELYGEVGKLFSVNSKLIGKLTGSLNSPFGRMGLTPEQLNRYFMRTKILGSTDGLARLPESGSFLDFDKILKEANELYGGNRLAATLDQWTDWTIDNPIDFLTSTHAALYKMATEVQFVDNFGTYALRPDVGLGTNNAAKAAELGFVKLDPSVNTHFGHILPDNLYVDESMAYIFNRMDEAMRPSALYDTPFGKAINTYFDPILNRWKTTVTILRPGHHVRNMIGSLSLRFFALGTKYFGPSDLLSGRILSRKNNYSEVDMIRASDNMTNSIPGDNEVVINTPLGNLTARQLEDDFYKYLAIEGKRAEDLMEDQILKTRFSQNVDKFFQVVTFNLGKRGGMPEEIALDASWYVQHRNILAHYIQALRQAADATPKKPFVRGLTDTAVPKNLDEARALALESALKYHPTPNMLSAWEKVFPRRLFPFYTWIKLASVALAEASILHPARTLTAIPKASYNLAVAMGVDPYSMYHPFPSDQMFPSFLTDEMTGPQAEIDNKYVAVSPGFASLDLYNTFANPVEGVTQLLNPMIRIPIELLSGSRLGTQAPITDMSDYIDSSIPGVNYVSNITGRSITGLGAPQSQVERGNKTVFDQSLSAFNWVTGLGVRNYTRPNYINFAEIEKRNAAAEETKVEENIVNFLLGRLQ